MKLKGGCEEGSFKGWRKERNGIQVTKAEVETVWGRKRTSKERKEVNSGKKKGRIPGAEAESSAFPWAVWKQRMGLLQSWCACSCWPWFTENQRAWLLEKHPWRQRGVNVVLGREHPFTADTGRLDSQSYLIWFKENIEMCSLLEFENANKDLRCHIQSKLSIERQ